MRVADSASNTSCSTSWIGRRILGQFRAQPTDLHELPLSLYLQGMILRQCLELLLNCRTLKFVLLVDKSLSLFLSDGQSGCTR